MHIFINDVATECPENSTILQVLTQQDISPLNIAIALDNTVVPKANGKRHWFGTVRNYSLSKRYREDKPTFLINNQYIKIRI